MTDKNEKQLTPQEWDFVRHFAKLGSAQKAMAAAGFSPDPSNGARLLRRPRIADAIDEIRQNAVSEAKLTHADALERAKRHVDEAREKGQYTAVVGLEKFYLQLSGLGPLVSERLEVVSTTVDIKDILDAARARSLINDSSTLPAGYRLIKEDVPLESEATEKKIGNPDFDILG